MVMSHPLLTVVRGSSQDNEFIDKYVDTFVDLSETPYRKVAVVIKELAIDILINTMVSQQTCFDFVQSTHGLH
jgi:hypothetical protein